MDNLSVIIVIVVVFIMLFSLYKITKYLDNIVGDAKDKKHQYQRRLNLTLT